MPEEGGSPAAATLEPTAEDLKALEYVPTGVASKVARKRALEAERRNRILNAKQRTIGIEKDVLDQQVAARKEQANAEKEYAAAVDATVVGIDNQLKILEVERKRMHVEVTRDVVEYNKVYCRKEDRREYALSDPQELKKETPLPEELMGPASVLRFAGEDAGRAQRVRAQQAQQRNWIEQQVYEKKVLADMEKQDVDEYAGSQKDLLALRSQVEQEEKVLRQEITSAALEYNETKRKEKQEFAEKSRFSRTVEEKIADYRENVAFANDAFINEAQPQILANGRIRRDHFKGMPKEMHLETANIQHQQVAFQESMKKVLKEEDAEFDKAAEETRRALVALEKERSRQYVDTVHSEMHRNSQRTHEQIKAMNKPARGTMGPEFFKGFGTSCR
ncbi:unnamed protein product [Amoebophrya sp. A25]|nr:unnamed protein product [Amoebophrya sp. A25]|eukprot:GSA25T00022521001.1